MVCAWCGHRCLVVLCCHPLLRCHSTLRWYFFVCQRLSEARGRLSEALQIFQRVCVALFYYTDMGESLRSRGQFLTAIDLGWPDPHPPP